jgi:hypothetical protein
VVLRLRSSVRCSAQGDGVAPVEFQIVREFASPRCSAGFAASIYYWAMGAACSPCQKERLPAPRIAWERRRDGFSSKACKF